MEEKCPCASIFCQAFHLPISLQPPSVYKMLLWNSPATYIRWILPQSQPLGAPSQPVEVRNSLARHFFRQCPARYESPVTVTINLAGSAPVERYMVVSGNMTKLQILRFRPLSSEGRRQWRAVHELAWASACISHYITLWNAWAREILRRNHHMLSHCFVNSSKICAPTRAPTTQNKKHKNTGVSSMWSLT